jgi:hypothetical protein
VVGLAVADHGGGSGDCHLDGILQEEVCAEGEDGGGVRLRRNGGGESQVKTRRR